MLTEVLRNVLHSDRVRKSFPIILNLASGIFATEFEGDLRAYVFSHTEFQYDEESDTLSSRTYLTIDMLFTKR